MLLYCAKRVAGIIRHCADVVPRQVMHAVSASVCGCGEGRGCGAAPLALRTATKQGLVIAGGGRANACVHARGCAFVTARSEGLPPLCRNYAALYLLRMEVHCARLYVRWAIPTREGRISLQRQRACERLQVRRGCDFCLMCESRHAEGSTFAGLRCCRRHRARVCLCMGAAQRVYGGR